jgi:hypothetical protein
LSIAINVLKKFVHQFGHWLRLYKDGRSAKHKKNVQRSLIQIKCEAGWYLVKELILRLLKNSASYTDIQLVPQRKHSRLQKYHTMYVKIPLPLGDNPTAVNKYYYYYTTQQ